MVLTIGAFCLQFDLVLVGGGGTPIFKITEVLVGNLKRIRVVEILFCGRDLNLFHP